MPGRKPMNAPMAPPLNASHLQRQTSLRPSSVCLPCDSLPTLDIESPCFHPSSISETQTDQQQKEVVERYLLDNPNRM